MEKSKTLSDGEEIKSNPNHLTESQQKKFDQIQTLIGERINKEMEGCGKKIQSAIAVHHGAVIPTPAEYNEVFPSVYIGGESLARDKTRLSSLHLTHVVNCAEGRKFGQVNTGAEFYQGSEVQYLGLKAHDSVKFDMSVHFKSSAEYIHDALTNGGNVYVHCHQGISRSTTIVLAYLMIYHSMDVVQALSEVLKHRLVYPNGGFLKRLIQLGDRLNAEKTSNVE